MGTMTALIAGKQEKFKLIEKSRRSGTREEAELLMLGRDQSLTETFLKRTRTLSEIYLWS